MTAWAHSTGYGTAVALGPTQEAVYRFVMGATENGRRPSFTLARIAVETGKPVSSVHAALGRLRALGLIGVDARTGRTGGHRLWRVVSRASAALDIARHRRAIARMIRRWYAPVPRINVAAESAPEALPWPDDPPAVDPSRPADHPFRDAMRRNGFTPWWRDDAGELEPGDDGGSECARVCAVPAVS